jgi:hypothetical protein
MDLEYLVDWNPAISIAWPASGLIFGPHLRLLMNLAVCWKEGRARKNVIFVVDTGSLSTYLSPQTIVEILPEGAVIPPAFNAVIHGVNHGVYMSPSTSNYHDVNVLGTDFMSKARLTLTANYEGLIYGLASNI